MATPNDTDSKADTVLHTLLAANASEVERVERERDAALTRRRGLWQRAVDAGWTQARIAAASRTTEGAVTQALRRARLAGR